VPLVTPSPATVIFAPCHEPRTARVMTTASRGVG
jgi:hypothetical protein